MKEKKLLWIIFFNVLIIVSEILFGFLSNSFALIADALHNTGDVLALVITYIALKAAQKKKNFRFTFGYLRAEMMAAFTNTLFLFLTMFYMIYEAILRLYNPQTIEAEYMVIVGGIALIANGVSAYLLREMELSSHHHGDANIYSAYLHMLSDALISFSVVVAGILIYYFQIYSIDAVLTIVFSLYILFHSYPLLKKSFLSLMDANTHLDDQDQLKKIIKADERVISYHDIHIYSPSSKDNFISFHIVLEDESITLKESSHLLQNLKKRLKEKGFTHILIQVETSP